MRGLQGSFPHCKKRLPSNFTHRRLVMESIVLIHNFRTDIVGSNQIKAVLDQEYERFITLDGMTVSAIITYNQKTSGPTLMGMKMIFIRNNIKLVIILFEMANFTRFCYYIDLNNR